MVVSEAVCSCLIGVVVIGSSLFSKLHFLVEPGAGDEGEAAEGGEARTAEAVAAIEASIDADDEVVVVVVIVAGVSFGGDEDEQELD